MFSFRLCAASRLAVLALASSFSASAFANCDELLFEFDVRGHQRKWAFTAIDEAGAGTLTACNYVARLAGIHVFRQKLAPQVSACAGAPADIDAMLAKEQKALDDLSPICGPFDQARCVALATQQLDLIASDLTPDIQKISLADDDLNTDDRCKFAISLKHFVMNGTADFAAIDAYCPKSFGDEVEAAMLPLRIVNAKRLLGAQEEKVKPWVMSRCE